MLWTFAILAVLLMGWALGYTHRLIWARGGYMSQQIYAGLLSGLAFLTAAVTLIVAVYQRRWGVVPVTLLPLPMAVVSDLILRRKRRKKSP